MPTDATRPDPPAKDDQPPEQKDDPAEDRPLPLRRGRFRLGRSAKAASASDEEEPADGRDS